MFSCTKEEVSPKNEIVGIYNTYSLENDAYWTENGSKYQKYFTDKEKSKNPSKALVDKKKL